MRLTPSTLLALGILALWSSLLEGLHLQPRGIALQARRSSRLHSLATPHSEELFSEAKSLMPGGVSSPVRSFSAVRNGPLFIQSAKDECITDVDGNSYIDYVGSWGTAIVGHANSAVLATIEETAKKGWSYGAPSALENKLARMIIDAVPSIDMVRFTNSGTEACMGMLRVARAFTKRDNIIKFQGCYHGHANDFLVQAGSGVATLGLPDSPGVPQGATQHVLVAKYNDLASVEELLKSKECAAVVVEPVVGNSGFVTPDHGFLQGLRDLTKKYGALLVFDEVMTGFRVAYGGAQEYYGVTPDMTTLGKIIGGGMPVGAFGGRRDIMSLVAPSGPVYHAGTLSGNPLAMAAGIQTLEILRNDRSGLGDKTKELVEGIISAGRAHGHQLAGGSVGAMFGFFFNDAPVRNFEDATRSDTEKYARFHRLMLERGIYFPPSQFEACFSALPHCGEPMRRTLSAVSDAFKALKS